WMTGLVPFYLKTAYSKEPIFQNSKVIYSLYDQSLGSSFNDSFVEKASINNLDPEDLSAYKDGDNINLHTGAATYADAVIRGSEALDAANEDLLEGLEKPYLEFKSEEEYLPAYLEFYNSLLEQEVE
ncbi:MAG: starch synthase, partial [Flavobacteriaceae bacterium]|nr:starch synthase [Flavobacteriaceae bacterium]